MRSRVVWVVVIGLAVMSASLLAQQPPLSDPNTFVTESCSGDRGLVRTGRVFGGTVAPVASARSISLLAFSKITYPNASDPTKWPSKLAPTSRTTGEGILYRIDNLEINGFANCLDSIVVEFNPFGLSVTQPQIDGLFPSAACMTGTAKTTIEAAKSVFTDQLSVWGTDTWHNSFEKACSDGGDGKSLQRVSVVGYSFWDDAGGTSPPTLRLAPLIAILDTSDSTGGGDNGGSGGPAPGGGAPSTSLAVVLPDDVITTPLTMANSSTATVLFSTVGTTTSDVTVTAQSDSDDLLVSLSRTTVPAPGSADITATIQTTSTTAARDHVVTITATDGTNTSSASFTVTVICDPPFILGIDQPKSTTVALGRPANLSVKASGSGPLTYQWFSGAKGLVNFPLAIGSSPNFTTSAINDTTSYWVRVTNPCGSVDSQTVTVSVAASAKPASNRR